jgi:hypothetical protein
MKLSWTFTAAGLLSAIGAIPAPAQAIRVGTFHKPSVIVAFYSSPMWSEVLKAKKAEMQQAKAANDTKKAQDLDAWGGAQQDLAHRQLSGDAPIDNILEALAPMFPDIAKTAQVSLIAPDLPYASPAVQTVDLTDLLLDALKANDNVRKIARELQSQKGPLPPLH